MGVSLLLIAGFLVVEARKAVPSFDLALFKTPTFTAAQVVLPVGVSFAFITLLFYLPFYLQGLGGMGPMQSGLALLPLTLPSFFVPFLAGWLAGFLSFRLIAAAGLAMLGVGTLLQSTLTPGAPDLTVFIGMALAGSGVGIVHAVNDNLAVSTAPPGKSGVAAGMLHTMRLSTETVAIIAAGAIMVTLTLGQLQAALPDIGEDAARLVARADIAGAAALAPDADAQAFTALATETSAAALRLVLMGLGAVAILCALLAALLIRQRDIPSPTDEDTA